jgi:ribosome modulation factor
MNSTHTQHPFTRRDFLRIAGAASLLPLGSPAADKDHIPQPGQFPPPGSGHYLSGELVLLDPARRRGALRLDGNEPHDRYQSGALHSFALLPYAMCWFNGAPAELRDLPIGTHVHGYFFLPPPGEERTIPPLPKGQEKYEVKYNHALSLEDDFSFYQRRGQAWKVVSVDEAKGKLNVAPTGTMAKDGINKPYIFDIDNVTRVWRGRTLVELKDIAPDTTVQLNLTWSQGWRDKEFTVSDLWLDDAARAAATELQRRRHVLYQRQRWVPGWIDAVENFDFGGGLLTLTLFGPMDRSLYDDLKTSQDKGFGVAVAEKDLRTWFHRSDKKIGKVVEWKETPNPPPGSSGIQVRMKFTELLDGYRPGRIVRVKSELWKFVTIPTEERVKSLEDR